MDSGISNLGRMSPSMIFPSTRILSPNLTGLINELSIMWHIPAVVQTIGSFTKDKATGSLQGTLLQTSERISSKSAGFSTGSIE
jgi:hypothetical protein